MTMKLTKLLLALSAAGLVMISSDSRVVAGTATAPLQVTATVTNNCTVDTEAVAFPNYDPIVTHASTPNYNTTGAVKVTCTKGTVVHIGLGQGNNFADSKRHMKDGGSNTLEYELFQDPGYVSVWGHQDPNRLTPEAAPSKAQRSFPVYGRIHAGLDVAAGSYSDTVVATVDF